MERSEVPRSSESPSDSTDHQDQDTAAAGNDGRWYYDMDETSDNDDDNDPDWHDMPDEDDEDEEFHGKSSRHGCAVS
jgi:hypothetical protein